MTLVGVDGCKGDRWVAIWKLDSETTLGVACIASPAEVLTRFPSPAVIAVDIPIGLTDSGRRAADVEARRVLKAPRASSVFPAPVRTVLNARTQKEASRIHRQTDGRGFGAQSWAILPRVRAWDLTLQANRDRVSEVFEVHPEVSFWALNDGKSIAESKKSLEGASRRRKLLVTRFGANAVSQALEVGRQDGAAMDDLLDALAALWSAGRIARGEQESLPASLVVDSINLPMVISDRRKEELVRDDILERLRIDPGQRTLGQLMQDREGAALEIARLRSKIERLEAQGKAQLPRVTAEQPTTTKLDAPRPYRAGPSVLRRKQVETHTGLSRSTIYLYVKNGEFPKPVALGPRAVGWLESDVSEWIARRVKLARDEPWQPAERE